MMILVMVFTMLPGMVFADTSDLNLVDYTGLQQGTTSRRIYMLNCGTLEQEFPAVFADNNEYTSRWDIKTNADQTEYFDNYIMDKPDSKADIEFVFSIGGGGMNHLDITDENFIKGVTDYVNIVDMNGDQYERNIDMIYTPHPGSGGGTGGGPSRAVDVIVTVAANTLKANETYRLALTSGLSSGRDALNKDIYFTFTTAPILVESIELDKTSTTLYKGETETISVKAVTPEDATDKTITWSSSDESVAVVDQNGKITAVGEGRASVTAASNDGNASAACEVKVEIPVVGDEGVDTKLVVDTENIEITDDLAAAGYSTKEDIIDALYAVIYEELNPVADESNTVVYDVKLQITTDGGKTWTDAAKENFPEEGISIGLDYPEGTSAEDQDFTVLHMVSENMDGYDAGDIEVMDAVEEEGGLVMNVSSLSPFSITWEDVEADGYYVYRCNKSGSTIRKWRWNNSVTSFNDGGLTTGTTYYYKIKAYKVVDDVTYDGTYTSLKAAKPALSRPGTPGVSRYSSSYVKVKWKGVSGESGYQVYRAKSKNGSYSRVASVKMTTSSYPYAKIRTAKGKTYYYKVRAYKKIGNRYVYSSFSAPKSYKLR